MKLAKILLIICIIIIIVFSVVKIGNIQNIFLQKIYPLNYKEYVQKYSEQFNVDSLYIYSIIKAESNYDEKAISNKGAKGLMQLLPLTAQDMAKELGIEFNENELLNPEINIMLGTKYFSKLTEMYGNYMLALAAYNAGPGNVNKWVSEEIIKSDGTDMEKIPYKETNMYVRKIVNNYKIYKNLYN